MKKEISVIAATFYGNRGAEGMLSTLMGKLWEKDPHLKFNIFTYYPTTDVGLVNDPRVKIYSSTPFYLVAVLFPTSILLKLCLFLRLHFLKRFFPDSILAISRSRMLVCLAGVSFVDGREKFLPFNIFTILPALILGTDVIKCAQAMGKFSSTANQLAAKFFLSPCRKIFTRGDKTHSYIQEFFGDGKFYERADDIAFLFEPQFCISTPAPGLEQGLAQIQNEKKLGRSVIGLCPSVVISIQSKRRGWDYEARQVELINELVGKNHSIALYPNATRAEHMDKTHNNDLPVLMKIMDALTPEVKKHVVHFHGSFNAAQIHSIIKSCDVQAVSRFHAMVAALKLGVPVMVIGWSHKYLEVMDRFGQGDMVLDYKNGGVEPIVQCLQKLLTEKEARSLKIKSAFPAVKELSLRQISYLEECLRHE